MNFKASLLCSENGALRISAQPSLHPRSLLQYLMGADTETPSQILGGAPGMLEKMERKGAEDWQEHNPESQLSRAHRAHRVWGGNSEASMGLLRALCIHTVVLKLGVSIGLLTVWVGVALTLLLAHRTFFFLLGCPNKPWYEGICPILIALCYVMFSW